MKFPRDFESIIRNAAIPYSCVARGLIRILATVGVAAQFIESPRLA